MMRFETPPSQYVRNPYAPSPSTPARSTRELLDYNTTPTQPSRVKRRRWALNTIALELLFEIIEWLDVKSITKLRQVSKYFADVTYRAPNILRTLLRDIKCPLPYSPKPIYTLSAPEVVRLVRRASNLEFNWKNSLKYASTSWFFPLERPYKVRVLPGGQYVVAATLSFSGETYSLGVYSIERPVNNHMASLVHCPTGGRLTWLHATWMHYKDRQGLAIVWIKSIDSRLPENRGRNTEVTVVWCSLEHLEMVAEGQIPDTLNGPFEIAFQRMFRTPWCTVSLDAGILIVARAVNNVSVYDLNQGIKTSMILRRLNPTGVIPESESAIFAVKLIDKTTFFMVRGESCHRQENTIHSIEIYSIPAWGVEHTNYQAWAEHRFFNGAYDYHISSMFQRQATSDHPTAKDYFDNCNYMAPISVCATGTPPTKGIINFRLEPKAIEKEGGGTQFTFNWPPHFWHGQYAEEDVERTHTILVAGADRSLGFPFTVPGRYQIAAIEEFMIVGLDDTPVTGQDDIPCYRFPEQLKDVQVEDANWDETSGKICLAAADDCQVWILDYGV